MELPDVMVQTIVVLLGYLMTANAAVVGDKQRHVRSWVESPPLQIQNIKEHQKTDQKVTNQAEDEHISGSCHSLADSYCADPVYDSTRNCYSCEHSKCKFKGCVRFGAFTTQWMPTPCKLCTCVDGKELCTTIQCSDIECHGFPNITIPGQCCPTCDYGIPENECGVIPAGLKSLYMALGDKSCQKDVSIHKCYRDYIYDEETGKHYKCTPVKSKQHTKLGTDCEGDIHGVTFLDVTQCRKVHVSTSLSGFPQDFDPNPHYCSIYVN